MPHPKDEYTLRRKKIDELRAEGINPYPSTSKRSVTVRAFLDRFDEWKKGASITIAGRIRLKRVHGKLTFIHSEDESGKIQIVCSADHLGEEQYQFIQDFLDLGDIVEWTGGPFITQKGERSLLANSCQLLAKAIRPLPEKWHGLEDQEERYRRRYVDLIVHPEARELFRKQAQFIRSLQVFLEKNGFIQLSMPVLEPIAGGAEAQPFKTHHETLNADYYLRICIELYQKRAIVGGFEKIYDLGPVFRNEGMDREHLQEFLELELYWAYANHEMMMELMEQMYAEAIQQTFQTLDIHYEDSILHFAPPWPRLDYVEAVKEKTGIDLDHYRDADALRKAIGKKGLDLEMTPHAGLGRIIDQLYKKTVRPHIQQPTFLVHHPVAVSPLAKRDAKNPEKTERFQILAAGAEIGNGYSELNDPLDQRRRFEEQQRLRDAGDREAHQMDEDFVEALEYGMPPTAGFGVGINRLFMLLSNQNTIRDVVLFPLMRPRSS